MIYNPRVAGSDPFSATTEGVEEAREQRTTLPTLRFVFRGSAGIVHEPAKLIPPGVVRVGRVRGDDAIALEHDSLASREHAAIVNSAKVGVCVEDLGSRNGVYVNGVKTEQRELKDGDVVRFGSTFGIVRFEDRTQRDLPNEAIIGSSPAMQRIRMAVHRIAPESASVLIVGPTGSGKEVVARALHAASGREGRFVAVNCSAIPSALAESHLFGHVAGAFTGAVQDREGCFRAAERGTLLLDEIGDMPLELQPKLLRALEAKEITPVGSTRSVKIDVRVLAATHVDVASRALEGGFRADLYARLAQLRIELPPLRERREDILALLEPHLGDVPPMTPELVDALLNASWPQNARELIAIATELRVWGKDRDKLGLDLVRSRLVLPERSPHSAPGLPTPEPAPHPDTKPPELTREMLVALLERHGGKIAAVAKELGRSRTQVYRLIDKHELDLNAFRPGG